ncbi:bifunctional 5,10-methylenetetrahydrofolate dehydrogenase/5,10-methenyltetrahydrofolate cyclohydrolase [Candidatus Kuenenbacteria bacterium]|nr:bifunctional 5,10-methylenetetrahydrofolate dehydrogenase/5,10-methenyltetrahydrofolate cyclohydrolase [Candidatus Kuenenbacteria bacterium]
MPDKIIDGKELSRKFLQKIKEQARELDSKPGLAAVLIGDDPSSHLYVKLKRYACDECEINFHKYVFEDNQTDEDIINCIEFLNKDPETTGVIVQLPLPEKYNTEKIIAALDYRKDIDGFHPKNQESMKKCDYKIMPPLPLAIIELVNSTKEIIENKNIVVLCNHKLFGDPFNCHWAKNNTVNILTLEDLGWKKKVAQADILIVAIGCVQLITSDMIKQDAIIIDVGINQLGDIVVGDVDFGGVLKKAKFITPVPGGVGPMTIAMLLQNLIELKKINRT